MHCDTLWYHAHLITVDGPGLGVIENGVIAATDGRIVHVGAAGTEAHLQPAQRIDCGGRWISPGLVDCHTHLVYAGNRAGEFEQRLQGVSYADIARAGGGIVSTVRATRAASEAELIAASLPRLDAMLAEGITTLEIKSGYGLSLDDETKQLRVARELGRLRAVEIVPTFLGAHAIPPGRDAQDYIDDVCNVMIPAVAVQELAEAVDVFCENIAFSAAQAEQVFVAARQHGLAIKITPNSSATSMAQRWLHATARCRPTISNTWMPRASRRWRRPAPWRCCCRARSISPATPPCPRSRRCVQPACRWHWQPIPTPAPRR